MFFSGPALDVPASVTPEQLEVLLNGLLQSEEKLPYSFYIEEQARMPLNNCSGSVFHPCSHAHISLLHAFIVPAAACRRRSLQMSWENTL